MNVKLNGLENLQDSLKDRLDKLYERLIYSNNEEEKQKVMETILLLETLLIE